MLRWLRHRQEARRLVQADAEALVATMAPRPMVRLASASATWSCPMGQPTPGRTPAHWRRAALIVARMMSKRVGLDTATRMLERGDDGADR